MSRYDFHRDAMMSAAASGDARALEKAQDAMNDDYSNLTRDEYHQLFQMAGQISACMLIGEVC